MNIQWDNRHGKVLVALLNEFDSNCIKYFILRNYEQLPNGNTSKDVDIIIEPSKIKQANKIITQVYRACGMTHYYLTQFTWVYCWHAMNIKEKVSIHIDLIAGYRVKGHEIFTFEELYAQTDTYSEFKVLNPLYDGLMIFIYKQFGYHNPTLKRDYKESISYAYNSFTSQFKHIIQSLIGKELAEKVFAAIEEKDFDKMLSHHKELTKRLKYYSFLKSPSKVVGGSIWFYWLKSKRIILQRGKYIKTFSVMAPDGAGKTTFLESLLDRIGFYFTKNVSYTHVYHFRPLLLPNLGAVGEKVKVMKQDTKFTTPHRAKPANPLSSLFRISYYWVDYVVGWFLYTAKDIQYDKFTVFDRYGYDLIVDPYRTRLDLPDWVRNLFVKLMPEPRISFYLDVEPDEILRRKQELTHDEIIRQVKEYRKLAKRNKRIITVDANRPVEEITEKAIEIILDSFCKKI